MFKKKQLAWWGSGLVGTAALLWFFRAVFAGQIILPQQLHVGPVTIYYYGLIMALAVLTGYLFALKRAPGYGITREQADGVIAVIIVAGFIGARVYTVVAQPSLYLQSWHAALATWNGGLSIYGAVLGGGVALAVYAYRKKIPLWQLLDWLLPSLTLGQIIGRFGNLFNYELYGGPTNLPWKMFVPLQFRLPEVANYSHFQPLFLYEALLSSVLLLVLLRQKPSAKPGLTALTWLIGYGTVRLILESFRVDSVFVAGVRFNGFISAVVIAAGVLLLLYRIATSSRESKSL
jgi:phosphatidylglycerol:prolipoprotein diacylglycerol transferase